MESADLENKRVFVSIDTENILDSGGQLIHDLTLRQAIDTIELLQDRGASILLLSQAGSTKRPVPFASLRERLSELLKTDIPLIQDPLNQGRSTIESMGSGQTGLIDNLLHYEGEESSDPKFASRLADLADAFVNESPGTLHRRDASLIHLPGLLPSYIGITCHRFVETIGGLDQLDARPMVLLLGGKRVARQCRLIARFLERVSVILLGGATAYTFMKSRALPVGNSLVEKSEEVAAFQMIEKAELAEAETVLPLDHIAGEQFSRKAKTKTFLRGAIPDGYTGLDIGPKSIAHYERILRQAKTILWYGTMGATEFESARKGTKAMAKALGRLKKSTVVAMGRETVHSIVEAGQSDRMTFNACGSSSVMELLLNGTAPALEVLDAP